MADYEPLEVRVHEIGTHLRTERGHDINFASEGVKIELFRGIDRENESVRHVVRVVMPWKVAYDLSSYEHDGAEEKARKSFLSYDAALERGCIISFVDSEVIIYH